MEVRVKTGSSVCCEYDKSVETRAVVNIVSDDGKETGWVSRDVLAHALSLFPGGGAEVASKTEPQQQPHFAPSAPMALADPVPVPPPVVPPAPSAPRAPVPRVVKDPPEFFEDFIQDLKDLRENPDSTNSKGESDGRVTEGSIRKIVKVHRRAIKDKSAMYEALLKVFSVHRERFDLMLASK